MRVGRLRVAVAVLLAATATACGNERPTAPDRVATANVVSQGSLSDLLGTVRSLLDTTITTILVDPSSTMTYAIGAHRLFVRAGGICDLSSSYGIGTWELPCVPLALPIVVTARSWYDPGGHPHVDFSPQLRFVPGTAEPSAQLFLRDWPGVFDPTSYVAYCNDTGCVDESRADTSLVSHRDTLNGFIYRRIKHFSGYEVAAGRADSASFMDSSQ